MSKYTYILDAGHGGMINGIYQTKGKQSPLFADNTRLREGVNNREIVELLKKEFKENDITFFDCVNSQSDISLEKRVKIANDFALKNKCVYISIHSDANGDGVKWDLASGMSVYTSIGQTQSDVFAELVINELQDNFKSTVKWRLDNTDKDKDKEENFYVLKHTSMPAILCELGFHTNLDECTKMKTIEFKNKIVLSIIYAIKKYEL